ncbi:MAG: amidohydrolase family protein, partial [Gemmataceae bacterium]|nr:amidohydrolase family protein [Gemmataceae bacterium]
MTARAPRLALLFVPLLAAPAAAQNAADLKPTAYAVKDARVVVEPGTVLPKATVVIRDGLIAAVGPDVAVPADALVIDGTGLTVYPGFVDAGSPRGYDPALRRSLAGPPAADDRDADPLVATKPDNRKGMTPEFAVQTALKPDEDAVAPWRRAGFTAHLVAPDGGYFSGTSALVSLSGAAPREAVLKAPVALHGEFGRVIGPDYPTALMGVVAHNRQTLLDAGWLRRRQAAFDAGGRVGRRPAADPCLEAFWPALDGKLPVVLKADTADQIHRALDFAAEFKLKPTIAGGRQAWKVADRLKAENVPVVLRLNFATAADSEKDLPIRVREELERKRQEDVACAAKLHAAGVKFAFMTQDLGGPRAAETSRENVRKAIAAGLPADAALAALTRDAADLLGVAPQVGRVTKGRAAHLSVTDGDFHAEKTKYKWAFADGVRFDLDEKAAPPAGAAATAAAGGDAPTQPRRGNRPAPKVD